MIQIDYRDPRPIYEQVVHGVKQLVLRGVLAPGEKLPSVRQLAMELSINPNTIQRAYSELEKAGVVCSAKGRGNFIADNAEAVRSQRLQDIGAQLGALAGEARALGAAEDWIRQATERKGESAL